MSVSVSSIGFSEIRRFIPDIEFFEIWIDCYQFCLWNNVLGYKKVFGWRNFVSAIMVDEHVILCYVQMQKNKILDKCNLNYKESHS